MKIAIMGPGAVGLLLAGRLQKTGAGVILVDELPERAARLGREGMRWEGADEDFRFSVPVVVGMEQASDADLIILCVKAYHTEAASRQIRQAGYRGPVMTLQNGVGNAAIIGRNCPDSPVIAGITSEGANLASDSHVRHAGSGKTVFGPIEKGRPSSRFMEELASLMGEAGFDAELSDDPESLVWGKVLVNAGINALTALLQVPNGRLVEIAPVRTLMRDLVLEGQAVVERKRIGLIYPDPVARTEEVCRLTAANNSSMLMDIRHGRRTEIDFINGAIVREGVSLGISCPYNDAVTKLVHGLEQRGEKS